jgi:hypothetical protein
MSNVTPIGPHVPASHEAPSSDPMEVVNDVCCTITQVRGIVDIAIDAIENECALPLESTAAGAVNALYGARELLTNAYRRCCEARPAK